nr:PsbP-related protein [uncultured Methanobacterium sp.]
MTKICPKCKTENLDSAAFCQNCGEELPKYTYNVPSSGDRAPESKAKGGNWWSKQTNLVKILSVVGVCCVGLIVIIGLLAILFPDATTFNLDTGNTPALTQTFSQAGLSFNYPGDWKTSSVKYVDNSASVVQSLGTFASPDNLVLDVSKQDMTATVAEAKEGTKANLKTISSSQILSETTKTVNGLTVYEMILTYSDSNNNEVKSLYVITGKDGQVSYYLQFIDTPSNFNSDKSVMDSIVNTIKIQ